MQTLHLITANTGTGEDLITTRWGWKPSSLLSCSDSIQQRSGYILARMEMKSRLPTQSWLRWEKDLSSFFLWCLDEVVRLLSKSFLSCYTRLFLLMELEIADFFFLVVVVVVKWEMVLFCPVYISMLPISPTPGMGYMKPKENSGSLRPCFPLDPEVPSQFASFSPSFRLF